MVQGAGGSGSNKAQDRLLGRTSFLARPTASFGSMHERPSGASGALPPPKQDECPPFPLVPLLKVRRRTGVPNHSVSEC